MSGYPKEIFIDGVKISRLLCVKCGLVLREAVQSVCGHRMCDECVKKILQENRSSGDHPRCPACSDDSEEAVLKDGQVYPDFPSRKELKTLQVKCCYDGCSWTGELQKYSTKHEAECEFVMLKCINSGCDKTMKRGKLANHLARDCPMRSVKCAQCGTELLYKNLKKHNSECPKTPITCKNCTKKIPRDMMKSHQDVKTGDCKKKKQQCPYASLGCSFKVTSGTGLTEHINNECVYHAQLQVEKFESLKEQFEGWLETERILSTLNSDQNKQEDAACANPKIPSVSSNQIDKLVTILKQWFVLKGDSEADINVRTLTKEARTTVPKSDSLKALESKVKELEGKLKKSEGDLNDMRTLYAVLDKRNETFQEVVAVLNNQLEAIGEKADGLQRENRHLQEVINQQEKQIHAHDQMLTIKNVALAEQELRIQTLESASYNGILVWKITEFARRKQEAVSGKTTSFYSQPFYTSYHGYKMRARIYLNGDGMGKGTHLSLFFVVMKGQYDNVLHWPFRQKTTFMLVDQGNREHVVDAFRPDPTSSSFKKPTSEMNIASGCPLFVNLNQVQSNQYSYLKDDCLFVKVIVDVSDLERI